MANPRQNLPNPCFRKGARAPRTPQELAKRCYKLACKKLEVDEKKHMYDVRERLLLYVTLNKAEKMMQAAKGPRMPWDDEDDDNCTAVGKIIFSPLERCPTPVPIKAGTSPCTDLIKRQPVSWGLALPLIPIVIILVTRSIIVSK
ncbi:hypothetical protein BC938DRAFT_475795 [Jimgerdemannia flammicorona]|uniref:Uncharacterized protein n=1 Tax=Jimgerdemannia flammicorona TaxID=994334 RepID=A0A433PNX2_9FUNG|nr:hypothetical protein BC938DRAFT_475795 [Jimgerdemannia flammicorona]